MAEVEVVVPSLGESVSEAQIGSWLKPDGATVRADEILLELETDKAAMEIPAPASGKLTVVAQPGQIVKPGDVIARIDTSAAAEPAVATPSNAAPAPPEPASTPDAPSAPQAPAPPPSPPAAATPADAPASPKTSPAVRKLLAEHGLDASQIPATGRGGRLTKADVESFLAARQAPAAAPQADGAPAESAAVPPAPQMPQVATQSDGSETERVPMTLLRRRIAERLVEAQRTAAILTTFNEIDMSATIALRKQYRDAFEKKHGVRLGFMSLFGRACIGALQEIREVNAQIDGTDIVYNRHVHLGIAVGTPRGLVVPVIRYADQMSIAELEQAIAALAGKARDGKLTPDDLTGGTFTISNGGVYGSLLSTPILNPPQTGILGMHKIEERPVVVDGEIVIRPMMYVALSYDHRLIDGEQAVTFLVRVKRYLEDPARMLLGV